MVYLLKVVTFPGFAPRPTSGGLARRNPTAGRFYGTYIQIYTEVH